MKKFIVINPEIYNVSYEIEAETAGEARDIFVNNGSMDEVGIEFECSLFDMRRLCDYDIKVEEVVE
mgnify:CR=1 FL=1